MKMGSPLQQICQTPSVEVLEARDFDVIDLVVDRLYGWVGSDHQPTRDELIELMEDICDAVDGVTEHCDKQDDLIGEYEDAEHKITTLEEGIHSLKGELEEAKSEKDKLQKQVDNADAKIAAALNEAAAARNELARVEANALAGAW